MCLKSVEINWLFDLDHCRSTVNNVLDDRNLMFLFTIISEEIVIVVDDRDFVQSLLLFVFPALCLHTS